MLCKKPASVLQHGKEICSGPVYSALFSTTGTISQDPSMPTWQCVLCIKVVIWSPPRQIITWPSWSLQLSCVQWHAPWSKPLPHNCILFSVTSPVGEKKKGKIKRKLQSSYFWHHHPSRAIGRRLAAPGRRRQQWGPVQAPAGCQAQTWN